ncbi:hypothetical protein RVR_311 [Actinacidiphila reveromycinica]|uniref:VWFA domain-containing protein n=1 Tax=Actinacidiphila reveromycinica TaxID=659352 RepID=A0A7U3UMS9_9ACTN|nr:hypothetical protein [Streptomyces sp. SN-593]BBA95452.1 hypothetical protein RVR_311 [Streptomyces sp. SN-593]
MSDTNRARLLPIYVLADESGSMNPYIDELNAGLRSLHAALAVEPMASAKVRFSVLGFADDVEERLRMVDLRDVDTFPRLCTRGSTSYAAVFEDLLVRVPQDVGALKAEGFQVHRPAVFFLSDGVPNDGDGWEGPYGRLTDKRVTPAAPNIIACGVGDADPHVIDAVATAHEFGFIADPDADVGQAIARFCTSLTTSVIASSRALDAADPRLTVDRPEHFTMAMDVI